MNGYNRKQKQDEHFVSFHVPRLKQQEEILPFHRKSYELPC